MALRIGTDRAFRTPDKLVELVAAVVEAEGAQETHWIEWKRTLPLTKVEGQFAIAKAILGFANREPGRAAAVCEGTAYLIVGAEAGSAEGITPVDHAKLGQGLRKYVEGVQWSAHDVRYRDITVLVVVVEAPRPGDPIHALARAYDKWDEGAVFHRGTAQTEPAGRREIDMLSKRFAKGAEDPELDLELSLYAAPIGRQRLDAAAIEEWLERHTSTVQVRRTADQPQRTPPVDPEQLSPELQRLTQSFLGSSIRPVPGFVDDRWATPEESAEFGRRLEAYVEQCRERLPDNIIRNIVRSELNKLEFVVVNETHDPVRDVQLLVEVPLLAMAFAGVPTTRKLPSLPKWPTVADKYMPDPPVTWGDEFHDPYGPFSPNSGSVEYRADTVEITFTVGDLRPGQRYETPQVTLVVDERAPTVLPVTMTVRAMNRRGSKSSTFELPVESEIISVDHWYDP